MNSERQAELQRKLSMGAVPRPPADLAQRIKADIPKYLEAHPAPSRFPWTLTMRVAASLILLVTSALVTFELMRPRYEKSVAAVAERERLVPPLPPPATQPPAPRAAVTSSGGETELSVDIVQHIPASAPEAASGVAAADSAAGANATPQAAREERAAVDFLAEAVQETTVQAAGEPVAPPAPPVPPPAAPAAPQVAEAAPQPVPQPVTPTAAARRTTADRVALAPAPAAPVPVTVPPPPMREEAAKLTATASAPSLVPEAYAYSLELHPSDVFGISTDPKAFTAVRHAIESGSRPAAGVVDVEALVNYFAGGKKPSRDVALEVEASPAPIEAEGDRAILRFTVDTARMSVPDRASVPPIARDAHLHVDIDPRAVASFRRIGDDGSVEAEEALLYNTSVTGLYELELKPNLRPNQRVATVQLKYISIKTGRAASLSKVIHRHDLVRTWDGASRRHRLAALGALWSETLRGTAGGKEVAQRAEELATQNPRDERARELANAASASTGGGK